MQVLQFPYAPNLDMFISQPSKQSTQYPKIHELINSNAAFKNHEIYAVEFQNETKYDIAIWDANTSIIYFYKGNETDGYKFVSKRDALKAQKITTSKSTYKIEYGKKYKLKAKTTGTGIFTYKSANPKIAAIDKNGQITIKGTGKTTITITASATGIHKQASKKITIIGVPKKQVIKSFKSKKKGALTVNWTKASVASGYQIVFAGNKKFTQNKKIRYAKSNKTVKFTFTKLTSKKRYYVKVRAYKTINGKRYYGTFSNIKYRKAK